MGTTINSNVMPLAPALLPMSQAAHALPIAATVTTAVSPLKRMAVLGPAPKATGWAVKDALLPYVDTLDDAFEGNVMATRHLPALDGPWND